MIKISNNEEDAMNEARYLLRIKPVEMKEKLQGIAEMQGRSLNSLINVILSGYLKNMEKRREKSK